MKKYLCNKLYVSAFFSVLFLVVFAAIGAKRFIALNKLDDSVDSSLQKPLIPPHDFAGRVWLVSYADGPEVYFANQNFLAQTAINKGIDFILMYRRPNIAPDFYQANRAILEQPRGAGYWLWKPYFILRTLEMVPEGDIVVYVDAGAFIKDNIIPLLQYTKTSDRVFVQNTHVNRGFMKHDTMVLMGMDDSVLDKPQLDAAVIIIKNTQSSRDFIKQWLDLCQNARLLTDQPSETKEYPDFNSHRHDQSILSLLYLKNPEGAHIISNAEKSIYFNHHKRRPNQADISLFKFNR
ncbi:MAG: hypothetical protein WCG04_03850 [Alphaproteobacteria bacterium]